VARTIIKETSRKKPYTFVMHNSIMKYTVILEEGEDGYIVVTVPALPGCVTQGKTKEEALKNAKEAIELYLDVLREDNEPIPQDIGTEVEVDA
jgi:predicted RNase H-like HicB family nuclease